MMYRRIWWSCLRHPKEPGESFVRSFLALKFSSRPNPRGRFFFLFNQYKSNNTMKYSM